VKWNYRGKQLREEKDDYPGAGEYIRSRDQIDANVEYQLTDRLAIFIAGRNITNETNEWEVSGPVAPSWSWMHSHTQFGAQYSLGIKGTF
jgi:outer membrane receptor protein involved in Fe transport